LSLNSQASRNKKKSKIWSHNKEKKPIFFRFQSKKMGHTCSMQEKPPSYSMYAAQVSQEYDKVAYERASKKRIADAKAAKYLNAHADKITNKAIAQMRKELRFPF
jgi:hypothetical protein